MLINNNELNDFLKKVPFNINLFNNHQHDYYQLSSQISVLKNLKGIKDKFKEITDDSKIPSVLSELSFAYLFAKHDFEVELIYDGHVRFINNSNKIKSPDFIAIINGDEHFVEVTSFSASNPNEELMHEFGDEIKKYPLSFWVEFSDTYSRPCLTSDDYNKRKEGIRILSGKIKSLLPTYKTIGDQVKIEDCIVHFEQFPDGEEGFIGGGVTSHVMPVEKISEHVKKRLEEKSQKLKSWDGSNKPNFYLLALDLEGFETLPSGLSHLLYGPITYCVPNDFIEKKPECYYRLREFLDSADYDLLDDRHKQFLFQVGYDISSPYIVNKLGAFMEKKEALSGITGVLVRSHNSFQYLPNPFSSKSSSQLIDFFDLPIVSEVFGKYLE